MIELYKVVEFSDMVSETFFFTSSDEEYEYDGDVYIPKAIGRTNAESKSELAKANIEISFAITDEAARRWIDTSSDKSVSFTVFTVELATDPIDEDDVEINVSWKGRLTSVKLDASQIKVICENVMTSMKRTGANRKYQRTCPYLLYNENTCGADMFDFREEISISAMSPSGTVLTSPEAASKPDGFYLGGILETTDGSKRYITRHVGNQLTISRPSAEITNAFSNTGYGNSYGLFYGQTVFYAYPGCDRTKETCKNKFNNLNNFGGFPFIPIKNPFGGSSIV